MRNLAYWIRSFSPLPSLFKDHAPSPYLFKDHVGAPNGKNDHGMADSGTDVMRLVRLRPKESVL